jgi:DNA-binding CsgD family transcriptional regulator
MPSPEIAEALLDAQGTMHHSVGAADDATAHARLRQAVVEMEGARGKLRADAPERALESWRTLVNARWSLIDEFQEGSRRYIVAYVNDLGTNGPEALSARERQVAIYVAAGHWTKLIAYHLGISDSTVRVLLARAKCKLGAHSREDLIRIVSSWPTQAKHKPE